MKSIIVTTAIALSCLVSTLVEAGETRDPGVNHRQANQRARIADGVRSGELTRSEARALRTEQRAIRAEEREFKSDGKLTKAERRELHHDLNESSRDIRREKHDGDKR